MERPSQGLDIAIKVLLILGLIGWVIFGFCTLGIGLLCLAWVIPMTVVAFKRMNGDAPYGTAFGVCSILFLNTIAGILMLVADGVNEKHFSQN